MTYIARMNGRTNNIYGRIREKFLLRLLMFTLLSALLAGCASGYGGYRDYREIPPVWSVKNSPVPVPYPRMKPQPPSGHKVIGINKSTTAKPGTGPVPRPVSGPVSGPVANVRVVTVHKGDTLYSISRRNGAEVRDVINANGLRPPYLLRPGDRLKIPSPRVHVVERGETSYGISRRYGIDVASLVRLNHLKSPYILSVGQKLKLPSQVSGDNVHTVSRKSKLPAPPPRSGDGFIWPVRGAILSGFGPKKGGLHNDGINIRVRRGAKVRAAEGGVVAYAGSELKGFGNLLLIKHADGWVTAYAHNERLLVKRGDRVRRGQNIALAGMTGNVLVPQLHFELRKGPRAVDPRRYLR